MRLSHIKLAGFKSFVDPTHIHLPGQIVGVVGPNGCGKSNVIDALRWVLGESKASALRGESMQDVIFNGSGRRKPVSRASVELVFDNSEGRAAGQWSSYAEISIGRVLQRNGDSSYLINNQKVRRRDITDIFLGTGLGARAYAIIEQGMISRIIEAKPEELRVFLEEAAGVSKYRDRRRETAQRLGDTEANLNRVGDILLEMESQLERLEQQAQTARRYRELEVARSASQQLFWLVKRLDAEAQRASCAAQIDAMRTEIEAKTAALRETESRLEMTRSAHYQLADRLHERQGELYSANAQISVLEEQIRHAQSQRLRLEQQISGAKLQIEQLHQQRSQAQALLDEWLQKQQDGAYDLEEAEMLAQSAGEQLPRTEDEARSAQEACNGLQRESLHLQQRLALEQAQQDHLQRSIAQIDAKLLRLRQELASLPKPDLAALELAEQELFALDMEHEEVGLKLAALQERLPQAEQQVREHRSELQQHERLLAQAEARLHALQKLQGMIGGDKDLQGWLNRHGLQSLPRLWQWLRIDAGWENALEAALRERLNALALPALSEMADAPPGRVALFEAAPPIDACFDAALEPLLSRIECQDQRAAGAVGEWLASVYAAADLGYAIEQRGRLCTGAFFVTPEGHLVGRHTVMYYAPDAELHGVLARQREIEALEVDSARLEQQVAQASRQLEEIEHNHRLIAEQLPPLRARSGEMQQRRHALQMQILRLGQVREKSEERGAQISHEIAELDASVEIERSAQADRAEQMAALRGQIDAAGIRLGAARQDAERLDARLRQERETAKQAQRALHEAEFFA